MSASKLVFLVVFFVFISLTKSEKSHGIVNVKVQTFVDLNHQLIEVIDEINFENRGSKNVKSYIYAVEDSDLYSIDFINSQKKKLNFKETVSNITNRSLFKVELDEEVGDRQYTIFAKRTYPNKIQPASKQRKIQEDQLMKYKGNVRFYSSYITEFCKTAYLLKNNTLVEVTKNASFQTSDKVIFGFNNLQPYETELIEIIFVNNDPFLVVKSLQRTIDVNHFGHILITDEVVIANYGASLVGPYEHSHLSKKPKGAAFHISTYLPASAQNIKFFDILGNSSKTQVYYFDNYVILKFKTRYPLYGGWKTSYILRYTVPIYEYLYSLDDNYFLQIRSIDYVIPDVVIEEAESKIFLPEGAEIKHIKKPPMLHLRMEGDYSGLGVFGRPVVALKLPKGQNFFESYDSDVGVAYQMKSLYLLRAPLVIIFYVEVVFLFILFVQKLYTK